MEILEKLPTMSDDHLATLAANAERLSTAGTKKQQTDAAQLLPAVQAELKARSEARAEVTAAKVAAAKAKKKKPVAKPAADAASA